MYVILVRLVHAVRHTFYQKVAASHEEKISLLMILPIFYFWEYARNWAHETFSPKYLTLWKPIFASVPQSTECLTPDLHSEIFKECWRSATAVASDLILVEAEGKWPFLVGMWLSWLLLVYCSRFACLQVALLQLNIVPSSILSTGNRQCITALIATHIIKGNWQIR